MTTAKAENVVDLDDHRSAESAAADLVPVLSEDAIALEFVNRNADTVRYDWTAGAWYVWTSYRWKRDATGVASSWTRSLVRSLVNDPAIGRSERRRFGTLRFTQGVEGFARRDQRIAVTRNHWDNDLDLIGTPSGTVDLKSGEFFDPAPDAFITRSVAVDPGGTIDCPTFLRFLDEITNHDPQFKRFLQQLVGYCLTGDTTEQKLAFIHGPGGTGKSTLINVMLGIGGDYATAADMSTFTDGKFEQHPQQFARLAGMRFVTASETEAGHKWRESRIKQLTGGDLITAHFMRENAFTYKPQAKFVFVGNHAPAFGNIDSAIKRRFLLVPLLHKPAEPNPRLEQDLQAEWPGILRWMINGAVDRYTHGSIVIPSVIENATAQYFLDQDLFGQWFAECIDIVVGGLTRGYERSADLYASWARYANARGELTGTQRQFNDQMRARGYEPDQIKALNTKGYWDIRLKHEQ